MLLFKQNTAVFALLLLVLTACGFAPMYGDASLNAKAGEAASIRPDIFIANIPDREGQFLRNALIDRIYKGTRPQDAAYTLKIAPLENNAIELGIQKNATATIIQKNLSTTAELIDNKTNKPVFSRQFKAFSSYNVVDNQFATMASERDTADNLLNEIADDITTEINIYFYDKK